MPSAYNGNHILNTGWHRMKRKVLVISDGTGITAEHLGNSLMSQFGNIEFEKQTFPYIDTVKVFK